MIVVVWIIVGICVALGIGMTLFLISEYAKGNI